tara:strand:+ start:1431 stop:1838 length:408 start_codon:yes stop_codon:yes gene_type:complete
MRKRKSMNNLNITPSAIKNEASAWVEYLNQIIGILCFTLGLAALGTNNPPLYGIASFIFVLIVHIPNIKRAQILKHLQSKKDLSELEQLARKDYFKQITTIDILPAALGYLFLSIVAFGWKTFENHPEIIKIIYG